MSYAYPRSTGASSLPSFSLNSSSSPSTIIHQTWDRVPSAAKQWFTEGVANFRSGKSQGSREAQGGIRLVLRRLVTVTNAVILLWIFTLWRGERTVFQQSIDTCAWEAWEAWPQDATPHHVAFVADPQLVDPHTYPGRPWPLSTLTVLYTDQYLRRSFHSIQKNLVPDSVLFLGDLFDGGREWATAKSSSPEKQYQDIKDDFWKREYGRFMKIFLDPWMKQQYGPLDGRGRKMIASLPGNHDLGFGTGIQEPVRQRFQSYFGESNRVDVIGNHTFVSIDTVSLSAMDQPDPLTGSSSKSDNGEEYPPRPIWKDADEFLDSMAVHKAHAETEELRVMQKKPENIQFEHRILDAAESSTLDQMEDKGAGFPTILLTHVPLYRKPATPCGPLRERSPPAAPNLEEDEPNSLRIAGGYQYQNVLTQTISTELITKAGPNVRQVFSGDDHDYCEVLHREFNGSPNEITVKSLSWAMGVRHPGFVLTSLWNPIDPITGESIQNGAPATIQNHLCLMPDQLGIFIHYACILGLSIVILFLSSACHILFARENVASNGIVLPLSEPRAYPSQHQYHTSGTSSSSILPPGGLASRGGMTAFPRYPDAQHADAYWGSDHDDENTKSKDKGVSRPTRAVGLRQNMYFIGWEFVRSIRTVAQIVLPFYFFLIWRW